MDQNKRLGMLWAPFIADAYALGAHWVYDQTQIANSGLNTEGLNDPMAIYHKGKKAGDFTHYGDQTLWLLEHLADHKSYDPLLFADLWQKRMSAYAGYVDSASRKTLENLANEVSPLASGSSSQDLSIAGSHAPLIYSMYDNLDEILEAVKLRCVMTHMSKEALDTSKFIVEVTTAILFGGELETTLRKASKHYGGAIQKMTEDAFHSKEQETNKAIQDFGPACGIEGGLSASLHLVLKYQDDFGAMLKANISAGGDSAARGMVAASILGAKLGFEAIKPPWIEEMTHYALIEKSIKTIA